MIELKKVCASYDRHTVLQDVSAVFPREKVSVLLGPNGCGKTTLLKTALGLLPRDRGEILYDGQEISSLTAREIALHAAYLSQSRNIPHISVGRMVLHGRFPHLSYPRHYRREDYEIVRHALQRTDSLDLIDRPMEELSGGQRQKVYLAMALAQETNTIFMDEPTTYLDVRHQLEVMDIARSLAEEGIAVVMVLHDLSLALRTADQTIVMNGGRILQSGTPDEIYASGTLQQVFSVQVRRMATEDGWQYYCTSDKEH